jgi:hypothetical protein
LHLYSKKGGAVVDVVMHSSSHLFKRSYVHRNIEIQNQQATVVHTLPYVCTYRIANYTTVSKQCDGAAYCGLEHASQVAAATGAFEALVLLLLLAAVVSASSNAAVRLFTSEISLSLVSTVTFKLATCTHVM